MSEELETMGGAAGLDRRDFIRKSAIVGGMVWAAPAVSTLGSRAFAGGTSLRGKGVSAFQFFVKNGGSSYKFDWEKGVLDGGLSQDLPTCVGTADSAYAFLKTDYCSANQEEDVATVVPSVVDIDGEAFIKYSITVPMGYTIEWVVVKESNLCYYKAVGGTFVEFTQPLVKSWPSFQPGGTGECPTS